MIPDLFWEPYVGNTWCDKFGSVFGKSDNGGTLRTAGDTIRTVCDRIKGTLWERPVCQILLW